ncbi:MAG: hypothetical protein QN229_07265 [Desulfurococcaceae archaeon TW002]
MGKEKKLVYVSENLVEEILRISRKKGTFISRFVEESLEQAIKLEDLGYSIEEAAEILEAIVSLRVLGGIFTPQEVFECLTESSCRSHEELLKKWFENGVLYGKYLRERFENPLHKLKNFLETVMWDLNEAELKQEENIIKLRCVSSTRTAKSTEFLAKFIEGVVTGLGHHIKKIEHVKGLILLEFTT